MRRTNNQDAHINRPPAEVVARPGHFFMVADGMGAHAAGERASEMAVCSPHSYIKRTEQPPHRAILDAIQDAHQQIKKQGEPTAFRSVQATADVLLIRRARRTTSETAEPIDSDGVYEDHFRPHLDWELSRAGKPQTNLEHAKEYHPLARSGLTHR